MPFVRANVLGFRIVNFWNSMPEDINNDNNNNKLICNMPDASVTDPVTAPSVNIFKGRFDKKYAYLQYCTDIDYVTV